MAVNRIWFPNTPSGTVPVSQRRQIGVGYPTINGTPPVGNTTGLPSTLSVNLTVGL